MEFVEYLDGMLAEKREHPANDLISFMLRTEEDGEKLTRDELLAQCVLLLVAGHETTRNLIGNGMLALLRNPGEMQRLRQDPGLLRSAVEEVLRYDAPVQGTSRVALEDVEYCGERIGAGQAMLCLMACANRDERQFPDADRFDVGRRNNPQLAFGAGAHACLGLHLARMEGQLALRNLLDRFSKIELREEDPQFIPALTSRGLQGLQIAVS
jgi:cytochrome P450